MFLFKNDYLNNTAIIDGEGNYFTYKKIKSLISDFSKYLSERSLAFILVSNDLESVVSYLSFLDKNHVILLLSDDIKDKYLNNLINIYEPKYIFSNREKIYNFEKKGIFKRKKLHINNNYKTIKLHKELSILLTTSGSTGSPKLVKITNKNIMANARSIASYLNITSNERSITSLPFHYSYGLSVINSQLTQGGSIVLSNNSMFEKNFWSNVNKHKVTNIAGVPYNYEILLKLGINKLNIKTVKFMTQAGGKLNDEKIQKLNIDFKAKNIKFYIMYGQTEATARMAYLPYKDIELKKNSIGVPIPNGEIWLENDNGKLITEEMVTGELIYKGPNVSMGYANSKKDLENGDINKGILRTGDLAYFDNDGYFYIKGKNTRFIKVFGHRVSLDSIEELITAKGYEVAVSGEENKVIIYLKHMINFPKEFFIEELSKELTLNMSAVEIKFIEEFPRLDSGKLDYKKLDL